MHFAYLLVIYIIKHGDNYMSTKVTYNTSIRHMDIIRV